VPFQSIVKGVTGEEDFFFHTIAAYRDRLRAVPAREEPRDD